MNIEKEAEYRDMNPDNNMFDDIMKASKVSNEACSTTDEDTKVEDDARYEITLLYNESVNRHPDNKEELHSRCSLIYTELVKQNVIKSSRFKRLSFEEIPIDFLKRVHSDSHIEKVLSCEKLAEDEIIEIFGPDNYQNKFTPECARLASGAALEGMKDVVSSSEVIKTAFCLIRPPGHHAMTHTSDGYCYFNNAGMAAKFAKDLFGLTRVCILDWDVHHGDGTQDIFYETDEVLFISVHRFENQKYFPYKPTAGHEYVGDKEGKGYNVNVAWSTTEDKLDESKVGTKEYKFLFEKLLFGIIQEYDPQLLIISAGFDSAKGDPLGKQQVEHDTYHWLCENLQRICPKILMVLEGGYSMDTLVSCTTISVKALMGYRKDFLFSDVTVDDILPEALKCMRQTAEAHSPYWKTAQNFGEMLS